MARNSRSEAIRRKKCRSQAMPIEEQHLAPSGKPLSRRAFAFRHTAVLNAEVLREHVTVGGC